MKKRRGDTQLTQLTQRAHLKQQTNWRAFAYDARVNKMAGAGNLTKSQAGGEKQGLCAFKTTTLLQIPRTSVKMTRQTNLEYLSEGKEQRTVTPRQNPTETSSLCRCYECNDHGKERKDVKTQVRTHARAPQKIMLCEGNKYRL